MAGLNRTLAEILRKAFAGQVQDVHVALPGQIVRYDATKNLADVQVMVQHPVWDEDNRRTYEDLGTLLGVPVIFPRGGGYVMTWPLSAGDTGQLVFHSTPIGEWRTTNQSSKPVDASRHSIGWPTFTPGLFADNNQFSSGDVSQRQAGVVIGKDGSSEQILIQPGLIQAGASGAASVANGQAVIDIISAIAACTPSGTETGLAAIKLALMTTDGYVAGGATGTKQVTTLFKAK
jgi:hypothetical protein